MTLDKIKPYAKAIVAFVAPGVTGLVAAVQDGSPGGSAVTGPEWVGIAAACILTSGAVFSVPNRDPLGIKQRESVMPPSESTGNSTGPHLHFSRDYLSKHDATYHGQDN